MCRDAGEPPKAPSPLWGGLGWGCPPLPPHKTLSFIVPSPLRGEGQGEGNPAAKEMLLKARGPAAANPSL